VDFLGYEILRNTIANNFSEFDEERVQQITNALVEHLYEFTKELLYTPNELSNYNQTEAIVTNTNQEAQKLITTMQKQLFALPEPRQQEIQVLLKQEINERIQELYNALYNEK